MQTEIAVYKLRQGNSRLLVSMPHVGTYLPSWLTPRLTPVALEVADTDWHLEQLYNFLDELDATVLIATHSRYLLDLNRPPDNSSLYPGQNTTGICPLDTFALEPLYQEGCAPDDVEIEQRIATFWQPYHQCLQAELNRIKGLHGDALLWEAHSIHSTVPRFFDGQLPHFNIGTADDQTCSRDIAQRILDIAQEHGYSGVINGRFKGGYITRQYGKPSQHVQALQMEIAFRTYLDETEPSNFKETIAAPVRPILKQMLQVMLSSSKL